MPLKHFFKNTKKGGTYPIYAQVLVVVAAFALMVILSYRFMSDIEHRHMLNNVNNAISSTHARISADLLEPETFLGSIAETIRIMLLRGENHEVISAYFKGLADYITVDEKLMSYSAGIYGYFETFDGRFYDSSGWIAPEGFWAEERPWYIAAEKANGKVGVTEPYKSVALNTDVLTFARRIYDEEGNPLGVVCLDITLERIEGYVIDTYVTEGGYGMLLDSQYKIIAHHNPDYIGTALREINDGHAIENELRLNNNIIERKTVNYNGDQSILFIQPLENGWYIAIMVYSKDYYQSVADIARILSVLGILLTLILSVILIRIILEKRKSDQRINAILDAMPLCTEIWNKNIELIDCNEESLKLFGFSEKKDFLDNYEKLSPQYQPDGRLSKEKSTVLVKEAFETGYSRDEWMFQKPDGELVPCDVTQIRIKIQNDFYVTSYMLDLRELKAATARMREADERTQIIFDTAPIGSFMHDKDFNILDCNMETVRIFELQDKQTFIENFFDFSPEYQPCGRKSSEMSLENNDKVFKDGYNRFEWMHQTLSGEPLPCEIILVRVKFKNEYVAAAYVRDLREYKALLEEINKENERYKMMAHWYESILDTIPFPLSVTDIDMNWTFINKAVENFLEVNRNDVIGQHCSNWRADICKTENCGIARLRQGKKNTYFVQKNSSFKVDTEILTGLNGEAIGHIEVVQDITKLEEMAKKQFEAETASKAKSTFLARVSHEIRTPMNAILGITEIQLQNENLPVETQEALGTIYNSGYLLLGIINDILDLSKIEAGKLELSLVNYDVASLINDTVHLNVMRYDSKPLEFILHIDENIPSTLYGDDLRIKQILNNLLSNAFKYTDSGEVSFSINSEYMGKGETDQIMLVFTVKDTGRGMTKEQLKKLFDEYTRFDAEASRTTVGTGLGMAITRYLILMMNGDINVESESGKGSVFTVRLPQGKIDDGVLGVELTKNLLEYRIDRMSQIKKMPQIIREYMPYGKVLVVDDVETNLYVAKGLMAPYGLEIETTSSGFNAIEKVKNGLTYDIIFMDHFMWNMDGMEATKIIRSMGYKKPIIALTANAVAGQAEVFINNGFDGFISKPIDIRQLNIALNKYIRDEYPDDVVEAARQKKKNTDQTPQSLISLELAGIFVRDAERTITALKTINENNYRRINDIQTYIISVHAMKSALANVGEIKLSSFARKLEHAGRDGDVALMTNETPAFINSLREVIEKIKPKDNVAEVGVIKENSDDMRYLREKLAAIKEACVAYDKKTAKAVVAELREKTWSRFTKEILDSISEHLLHSEFEKAAEIASSIL